MEARARLPSVRVPESILSRERVASVADKSSVLNIRGDPAIVLCAALVLYIGTLRD